ncbi:hypothetical protein SAY86_016373 [Trapa natans]|uniref:Uncharacterized protein n=1 Tax=Trapa natans TaxID=22666 RepID=A0AAN7LK43_TRANT|nr:hypothetical protein SAY86_016373 [Trapa natans]
MVVSVDLSVSSDQVLYSNDAKQFDPEIFALLIHLDIPSTNKLVHIKLQIVLFFNILHLPLAQSLEDSTHVKKYFFEDECIGYYTKVSSSSLINIRRRKVTFQYLILFSTTFLHDFTETHPILSIYIPSYRICDFILNN